MFMYFPYTTGKRFYKNILQDVVNSVTDCKITNGQIEVFPKGDKGNAIFCHSSEYLQMKIISIKITLYKRKILLLKAKT